MKTSARMKFALPVCLLALLGGPAWSSPYATEVISYTPGTAHGVGNPGPYQTDATQALGMPTRNTGDPPWDSQVGVFYPAWQSDELVIVGEGGQLVVKFDHQVEDDPLNTYGVDLLVFGNACYSLDPNLPDYHTTGDIFEEPGNIAVSQDSTIWYDVVPEGDTAFPTLSYVDTVYNGWGNYDGTIETDFTKPVDPTFDATGMSEAQINAAYAGSGGGTGIDISETGLSWIQYVKVYQPAGDTWSTEIDAFADVAPVPEPSTIVLTAIACLSLLFWWRRRRT